MAFSPAFTLHLKQESSKVVGVFKSVMLFSDMVHATSRLNSRFGEAQTGEENDHDTEY